MKIFNYFKKSREAEKHIVVSGILTEIFNNVLEFTPSEQTEILNRVSINVMERKKETLSQLVREARDVKNSIQDIKI